jgi:hypothetical protein
MDTRQQAIDAVGALDADLDALQAVQKTFRDTYRILKSQLEQGNPVRQALAQMDIPVLREELAAEMVRIDQARQRVRTHLIALCLEEEVSISEVGRLWGFSRQLAQRYAKQVRRPGATDPTEAIGHLVAPA